MSYAVFIWSSYAIAMAALGTLAIVSVVARNRVRRELAERGLERKR